MAMTHRLGGRARGSRPNSLSACNARPSLLSLEDRSVPATFFIDPVLTGSVDGATVGFNVGKTGEVTGLRYASSAAFFKSDVVTNPTAKYAFSDLRQAIEASEFNAGEDTIQIAASASKIVLNNSQVSSPVNGGTINSVTITQPLSLIGSGQTLTTIAPSTDTLFSDGSTTTIDSQTAVIRVTALNGAKGALTVSDLAFDGTGRKLGFGFSIEDGATGKFTRTTVQNVVFSATDNSEGIAILGFKAASLTVSESKILGYGRVGVQFGNTSGAISDSIVTGRGTGVFFNSGVDVYGASTVSVSGNTITNNAGVVGKFISDGVLAYADPENTALTPTVTVVGNTITGNGYGIAQGLPDVADNSKVLAQFNNIVGNVTFGILNQSGLGDLSAPNNNFGDPTGPTNPTLNPGGKGDAISTKVAFTPALGGTTPVEVGPGVDEYLNNITTVVTKLALDPSTGNKISNGTVKYNVTFSEPVTDFTASDIIVSGVTPTPTATVTGSGTTFSVVLSNVPNNAGAITVEVANRAGRTTSGFLSTKASQTFAFNPQLPGLAPVTAVGADVGGSPVVNVLSAIGKTQGTTTVFDSKFTGGVRTAVADFNADGVPDLVVGTGVGVATQVRILNGTNNAEIGSFSPFEARFTLGVFVAAGDVTGDGVPDVIVTPDEGGGPRVVIHSGAKFAQVASFLGIDDALFRGGARAALGDFNQDTKLDLVVAAGFGGGPRIATYNGTTLTSGTPTRLFADFFVFEQTLRNGAFVAAGDTNGDGVADLIAGGGPSGGPRVFVLSGTGLIAGQGDKAPVLGNFFAGNPNNRNGIRVTAKDLNGDNRADIVVGPGSGDGSRIIGYNSTTLAPSGTPTALWETEAFPGFNGGAYVG